MPLDSEGSSHWRCELSVQWFSRTHYHILWNEERSPGVVTECGCKTGCPVITWRHFIKQREITLKGFRNGDFGVLVAANVAANGLDIPEIVLVVQSSPPKSAESYIHRSGRTGRAGRTRVCICFYQHKEEYQLAQVEQKAGIKFKWIGVLSATEIIKSYSKDAIRLLDSVPPTSSSQMRSWLRRELWKPWQQPWPTFPVPRR